jgi:hypothetical protein
MKNLNLLMEAALQEVYLDDKEMSTIALHYLDQIPALSRSIYDRYVSALWEVEYHATVNPAVTSGGLMAILGDDHDLIAGYCRLSLCYGGAFAGDMYEHACGLVGISPTAMKARMDAWAKRTGIPLFIDDGKAVFLTLWGLPRDLTSGLLPINAHLHRAQQH